MILYAELAEDYFAIEANHRDIADDVIFLRSYLPKQGAISILDIGCGTGEHLGMLAREGAKCTGIDASEHMIRIARRRHPGCEFSVADMRRFDYYEKFNMVTCFFGSLDYLIDDADIEAVLWNTRRALRMNGRAVFEIWNAAPVLLFGSRDIQPVSTTYASGRKILRERGFKVIEAGSFVTVRVDYRYTVTHGADMESMTDTHLMRAYRSGEFEQLAAKNGMSVIDCYSNTAKEAVREHSNRLVYVLEKN